MQLLFVAIRTVVIRIFAVAILLLNTAADAKHQRSMPGGKACRSGKVSHTECFNRCLALGGLGQSRNQTSCARRCSRLGCR